MYCVSCGKALTDTNRRGLVCKDCYAEKMEQRKYTSLQVNYCFRCGQPCQPQSEKAIGHPVCMRFVDS